MKVNQVRLSLIAVSVALSAALLTSLATPAFAGGCSVGTACTKYVDGQGQSATCGNGISNCLCGGQAQAACNTQ